MHVPRLATYGASGPNTAELGAAGLARLQRCLGAPPQLVVVVCTEEHDLEQLCRTTRAAFPQAQVAGTTTAVGVVTEQQFWEGPAVGMFGVLDPHGAYGVALVPLDGAPRRAAATAMRAAGAAAGRPGELPECALMFGVAGHEERLLEGIHDVVGPKMPVLGGSAGDQDFSGRWRLSTHAHASPDAVVVVAMFPSAPLRWAHRSGYTPTQHNGRVTRASGRRLYEIDGEPAGDVYARWTGIRVDATLEPATSLLARTTLSPIGRRVGMVAQLPIYALSLPNAILADRSMEMLTEMATGDELVLMEGTAEALLNRTTRAVAAARLNRPILGGITIHCVCYALAIGKHKAEISARVRDALGDVPVLGWFTHGEQGPRVDGGGNMHANLMTTAVLFGDGSDPHDA